MTFRLQGNGSDELSELKYEYDKAARLRDSLQKNLERRRKLGLTDKIYERQLLDEIGEIDRDLDSLKRKIRAIESVRIRSGNISDGGLGA
jgi:hypothetical protein